MHIRQPQKEKTFIFALIAFLGVDDKLKIGFVSGIIDPVRSCFFGGGLNLRVDA